MVTVCANSFATFSHDEINAHKSLPRLSSGRLKRVAENYPRRKKMKRRLRLFINAPAVLLSNVVYVLFGHPWSVLWCIDHQPDKFVHNIYGDEINHANARSVWKCRCGRKVLQPELYRGEVRRCNCNREIATEEEVCPCCGDRSGVNVYDQWRRIGKAWEAAQSEKEGK